MLVNGNIKDEVKILSIQSGVKFSTVASDMGVAPSAITIALKANVVNARFIEICEAIGYDVKLEFIKRENE